VLNICKAAKRNLRIRRARFSALIARDIEHSLRNLTDPNQHESDAVDIRMELDLRIGFAFTRFQTNRWRYRFEMHAEEEPISYGPCQFPTLGFVVDQYWKHKHFKSDPFWHIDLDVVKSGVKATLNWKRVRLFDHLVCLVIYQNLLDNTRCQVIDVKKRPAMKNSPLPLTTVELQKAMSRFHHIPAHDTMLIAERLYQAGYISYPRTETDKFPANFDFHILLDQQSQSNKWGEYAARLRNGEFKTPKAGPHDDASHPPIHPIKFVDSLQGSESKIYDFIVLHYLACCSDDAQGNETVVEVSIGPEIFSCKGLAITKMNFLEIYPFIKWSDSTIPDFVLGEFVEPTKLTMEEGRTTAPPLLTEADLIQLMNQNGIGTDATIAEHINTIINRHYVVKKGARMEMSPTQLGEALVAGYNFIGYRHMNQPQLRASLESDLKKVCVQQMRKDDLLKQQIQMYKQFFNEVRSKVAALDKALAKYFPPMGTVIVKEEPRFSKCGTCQGWMSLRLGKSDFNSLFCSTCNNTALRLPMGAVSNQTNQEGGINSTFNCPVCQYQVVSITSKNEKVFNVCPYCYNNPPEHVKPHLKIDIRSGELQSMPCFLCTHQGCPLKAGKITYDSLPVRNCPSCSSPMVIRQSKNQSYMLACSTYPACRKSIWFPLEIVSEVRPTATPCATCTNRPSNLVDIVYSPKEAFESGKDSDTGCMYGCAGGSKGVRSLLNEITQGLTTWETTAAPPPPIDRIPAFVGGGMKGAGAKKTGSNNAFSRPGSGGNTIVAGKKSYGYNATSSTLTAKATSKIGGGAKSTTSAQTKKNASAKAIFSSIGGAKATAKTTIHTNSTANPMAADGVRSGVSKNPFVSPHVQIHRQPKISSAQSSASSTLPYGSSQNRPFGVHR
jgi:DNA topoisomerase-3